MESAIWSKRANYVTSRVSSVGGRLRVADGRLSFEPNVFVRDVDRLAAELSMLVEGR